MYNVLDLFERTVERFSGKAAFFSEDDSISFEMIRVNARKIGAYLSQIIEVKKPIVILTDKSVKVPSYFLGCLYAGCFYVPVNTEYPKFRIKSILETVNAEIVLAEKKYAGLMDGLDFSGQTVIVEDIMNSDVDESKLESIRQEILDSDPIYVIFTSGSTGIPKGVVTSHKAVVDYINAFKEVAQINSDDIMGNQSPFDYDGSIRDIYFTLFEGASTFIIPKTYFSLPIKLFATLKDRHVTAITWAVSALTLPVTMNAFEHCVPDTIKKVMFAGSAMHCKHLAVWQRYLPDAIYINHYGPTEVTGTCTYYKVCGKVSDEEILPIGKPFKNEKVILLDKNGKQTPFGEVGEICVGGSGIAYGYYNNEEKTKECFIQNPLNPSYPEIIYRTGDLGHFREDGQLIFHGREDFQIKHMGHRIELGEIENTARLIDSIAECVCLYNKEKQKLYMFFKGTATKKEISIYLRERLPDHMIPRKMIKIESMPIKPNGKFDLEKLREMM